MRHVRMACREGAQPFEEIRGYRCAGLDLHGNHVGSCFQQEVDLVSFGVPPEMKITAMAPVIPVLEGFDNDKVFKEVAPQGVPSDVDLFLCTQKIRGQSNVIEIEFWRLDLPSGDTAEPGLKKENHVAGLKQSQPVTGRCVRHACVASKALQVEQLPCPARTESQESLKKRKILDHGELPDIPLHIGSQVIPQGVGRIESGIVDPWIETGKEKSIRLVYESCIAQLLLAQGKQLQERCPAGEGLVDRGHYLELLASSEDEEARFLSFIHQGLDVGYKFRNSLDFIENRTLFTGGEETTRVGPCELSNVGMGVIGKKNDEDGSVDSSAQPPPEDLVKVLPFADHEDIYGF
jgi:hypothetical protein